MPERPKPPAHAADAATPTDLVPLDPGGDHGLTDQPCKQVLPEGASMVRAATAGFLAWLLPGLGHLYLGRRGTGWICLVTITVTFWAGVAVGSVQGTVAPHSRKIWFIAQLGAGGHALAAYGLHCIVSPESARSSKPFYAGHWVSADVGVHYTGVAGLLNFLVILDAIARAEPVRSRTRQRYPSTGVP